MAHYLWVIDIRTSTNNEWREWAYFGTRQAAELEAQKKGVDGYYTRVRKEKLR